MVSRNKNHLIPFVRPEFLPSISVFQVFEGWMFVARRNPCPHHTASFISARYSISLRRGVTSHTRASTAPGIVAATSGGQIVPAFDGPQETGPSEKQRFPWDGEPLRWIDSFWYAFFFSLTRRCAVEGFCTHELVWYNTVLFAGMSVLLLVPPRNPLSINWIERLLVGLSRWFGRATLKAFTWHRKHARTSLPTTVWGF